MEEASLLSVKKRKYRVCQHCDKEVSVRVYKKHKRLYFSTSKNSWTKEEDQHLSSSELSSLDLELDESAEKVQNYCLGESEGIEWSDGSGERRCEDLPCQGVCCIGILILAM